MQRSNGTLLWLSGALALGLFVAMAIHSSPLTPAIPALQLTFNEAAFRAILTQWGPDGVALFRQHFRIDFPVLASYGLFGYLFARHSSLFDRLAPLPRRLSGGLLPTAAGLDTIENLLHLRFIADPATHAPALYLIAGLVASGKWLLIAAFALCSGYLLLVRSRR